jgi:hypothetical protein
LLLVQASTAITDSSAPAPTANQDPAPVAPVVVSVTSDAFAYKRGTVQVALTMTDGAITSVKMVQGARLTVGLMPTFPW